MSEQLAIAAEQLGQDSLIIDSYKALYDGKGFFVTKCSEISGAKRRPPKFPESAEDLMKNWTNSEWFVSSQRKYLMYLAGLSMDTSPSSSDYEKLKSAYQKWKKGYYIVFIGIDAKWACNLFVGEALFRTGKPCLTGEDLFYSAKAIWDNAPNFTPITNLDDVQRGDIVGMSGGNHVEIVTQVLRGRKLKTWIKDFSIDDGFCSIGAGRFPADDNGKEKCDGNYLNGSRELGDSDNKFFRI